MTEPNNHVIVAVPREDDPVWKISSEKVPHLTILFLGPGEDSRVPQIAQFLEHAVNVCAVPRFGLDVDRRGTLGPDEADVLFFQDNWELPRLRDFRSMLLKEPNIKKGYDSVEQFPEWTPHLTLGYPTSPAKPTTERIYWVQFDKLALWTGDSTGPEFLLPNEYPMEVMMSEHSAMGRQFLSHYGVKGMRWGHRKDASPGEIQVKATVQRHGKTKVSAKGGASHPASEDAVRVAAARQKLKKSGTHALSNKELQDVATRLNLEKQVTQLEGQRSSSGQRFAKEVAGNVGRQQVTRLASDVASNQVSRLLTGGKKR